MTTKKEASVLYQTFMEADRLRVQALKDGATREIANSIVAKALEQAWPKGRDEPWRYLCTACDDAGWKISQCPGDGSCGRKNAHLAHDYAQPCWCVKGQAVKGRPRVEADELAAVGKTRKPSRFGRDIN